MFRIRLVLLLILPFVLEVTNYRTYDRPLPPLEISWISFKGLKIIFFENIIPNKG